jgi:hypothetical protein
LATNFESDSLDTVGLQWKDCRYRQRLIEAKASGRLISLEQFTGMTPQSVGPGASTLDAYAQSWGLFRYLLERHPDALKKYMSELASVWTPRQNPETLRRRFIAVFGPVRPLEEDFLRFVDRLPTSGTGVN